jgi:hypothetical protein
MHFVSASNGVRCHVGCEGEVAEPNGEKYVTRHVLWKNRTKCGPTHLFNKSGISMPTWLNLLVVLICLN